MLDQLVGQSLDRYQIVELLGEGGMGAVFKARDVTLQRDVAIKVMQPQAARQSNFQERFLQEARTAARLDHPGIVKVFDFGQAQGLLYIVMEFIPGDNVRQMLKDLKAADRWIALPEAVQLVRQVCLALYYAHQQGILHRDIKPDNIMLKPGEADGLPYRPVITDLGLAKLVEGGLLTQDGMSMGTPSYMSPEQAMGEKSDARSDVYSLGILLYELAAGRLPFPIRTLTEAIRYHTKEPPPPPRSVRPDLPEPLERVIMRALEKDPADRFTDAAALAKALQEALSTPEATQMQAATQLGEVGLMTQYQQSIARQRGPSIMGQFPEAPADLGQDRISILAPDGGVRAHPIRGQEVTIGRGADADLVLDDPKVSRHHARVKFDGTDYRVLDLNSTNGTYLANAKLLPGVPEVWAPDKALRIGDCWLRLERAQQRGPGRTAAIAGTMASAGLASMGTGAGRVAAFTEKPELSVDPGSSTTATVTILNQGPVVDHFQVSVAGLPADWVPALPPLIRLLPGAQQQVSVAIQPPRSPKSRAGTYPLTIRVTSQDQPGQVAELQARLTVNPYSQFQGELKPQSVRAGKTAQLRVENLGNMPQTFSLTWQDRAEELDFRPPQAQLTVPEGQVAATEFRAVARERRWIGGKKPHPFSAQVISQEGEKLALNGEAVSAGLIPAWLPPLLLVPLIALCVLLVMMIRRPPVISSITVDPPNPTAGEPVTVHWVVENANRIELRPLVSDLDPRLGQYTFSEGLPAATTFTLVAQNRFGSAEQPVSIGVVALAPTATPEPGAPVVEEWSVFPTSVTKGQPVTIKWRVSNAESVTLQPFGNVENADEMQDTPQQTIRYTLIAVNKGKTVQKSQEVVVELPLPGAPVVTAFAVDPSTVVKGEVATIQISWDVQDADTVAIEPGLGPVGPVGSREAPAPSADTVYTLVAKNAGGETRAEAQVSVVEPTPTPTKTPSVTPTPGPTWQNAVTLLDKHSIYHIRVVQPGTIKVRATWTGTQSNLALIINGPGQVGYYARKDGSSPLEVIYNVTQANLAAGDDWRGSIVSFGNGQANGTVQITYPSGSTISPFKNTFVVKPGYSSSVSVIVVRRLLADVGGMFKGEATWTGTPANLALIINGPGQVGYYARKDGPSPLTVSYAASDADLDAGDTWRVSLASFSTANANGALKLYYPYQFLQLIQPVAPLVPSSP